MSHEEDRSTHEASGAVVAQIEVQDKSVDDVAENSSSISIQAVSFSDNFSLVNFSQLQCDPSVEE